MDFEDRMETDWGPYHQEGIQIAINAQRVIGDRGTLAYEKPYEDPNSKTDEARTIQLD